MSTIGAQASQTSLLTQRTLMEKALSVLPVAITFLPPGWLMDNAALDIASVLEPGMINSFLHPLDKQVPMIASADVGEVAAQLLQEQWTGTRIVELVLDGFNEEWIKFEYGAEVRRKGGTTLETVLKGLLDQTK